MWTWTLEVSSSRNRTMKARAFSSHGNKTKYLFWLLQTSVRRIVYGVCTAGSGEEKAEKKNCTTSREQGWGIRGHCKEPDTLLRPLLRQFHLLFLPLPTAAIHMMTVLLTLASAWPVVAGAWQSCQSWAFCWQLIGRPEKGELLQLSERLASWARLRWKWQSGGLRKDRQAALEQAYVNQPDRAVP